MCVYKFNGGYGAILCSNCGVIVAQGRDCEKQEYIEAIENGTPIFCSDECEIEWFNDLNNI